MRKGAVLGAMILGLGCSSSVGQGGPGGTPRAPGGVPPTSLADHSPEGIGLASTALTSQDGGTTSDLATEDGAVYVTATQFDSDLANAICQHLLSCGKLDSANQSACVELYTFAEPADRQGEINAGKLGLNEKQCLDAISTSRCDGEDEFAVLYGQCSLKAFVAMVPSDGVSSCLGDPECQGGYCKHGTLASGGTAPDGCPGVCAPFAAAGAPCVDTVNSTDCNPDVAMCDPTTKTCVARLAAGQGDCTTSTVGCQVGLYCDFSTTLCVSPTSPASVGLPCNVLQSLETATPACQIGLYCSAPGAPSGNYAGTCVSKIAAGSPCSLGDVPFFSDNQCQDGSSCYQAPGQTQPLCQPNPGLGQPCDPANDTCKATTYCDPATSTCAALLADGATCDPSAPRCLSGSLFGGSNCVTSGGTSTCMASKGYGNACNASTDSAVCATGLCNSSTAQCSIQCQ